MHQNPEVSLLARSESRRIVISVGVWLLWLQAFVYSQDANQVEIGKTDKRPFLGAFLSNVDDPASQELGVKATQGAVVTRTTARSPAKEFGLLPGDVIVSFDGEPVKNASDFFRQFRKCTIDAVVVFEVDRKGERKQIEVKLRALGEAPPTPKPSPEKSEEKSSTQTEAAESRLEYRNPEGLFQVKLPAGWSVSYGVRGKLKDGDFDTFTDPEKKYLVSCRRKSDSALDAMESLEEFREKNRLATASMKDVELTGYSDKGLPWMQVTYVQPESGLLVCNLATVVKSRRIQFNLVSVEVTKRLKIPDAIGQLIQSIEFAKSDTQKGVLKPSSETVFEQTAKKKAVVIPEPKIVSRQLDGKRRLIGVSTESAGRPAALALGIESPSGSVITKVFPETPAARAGLRAGDLVVQFGEHPIENLEDMEAATLTSPINSLQPVTFVRGMERLKVDIQISQGDSSRPLLQQYVSNTGLYRFEIFPQWKIDPNARREEVSGRVFDLIESSNGNFLLHLFHDSQAAPDAEKALADFVAQTAPLFLQGEIGRVNFGDIPAVFTSGVIGRERLFTLYRLAFVIKQQRIEIYCFTPPINDPAQLPHAVEAILSTLRE